MRSNLFVFPMAGNEGRDAWVAALQTFDFDFVGPPRIG